MRRLRLLLENIKFEHTIFALPFAYLGMVLATQGLPTGSQILWITVAMTGARTLAMGTNRLADRYQDAANLRTAGRPLPMGRLSAVEVALFSAAGLAALTVAAWRLNPLCLQLLPVAVVGLVGYSFSKRFTWLTHFILGIVDGGAPVGGWIAVTGTLAWEPILLGLAVAFWIAGFDLIYACQDVDFDREHGVHSVPARFSVAFSLQLSTACHLLTIALLMSAGLALGLGALFWIGLLAAAALLGYEHRLVSPRDLSRLNMAFFNVNGYIAVIVFVFSFGGLYF